MAMKQTDESKEQDLVAGATECPICSEKLYNNRLLPCGHTFCLKCLELYKQKANPKGKSLLCPICRREFEIPKGGCSSLTKNFALEQLIGAQKPVKDDMAQCDVCDHDRRMTAILFCLQCEQNLCVDCERTHKKMKSTSMHHVVPISKNNQHRHSVNKNYCEQHVDQGLELVCSDCNEAICWKCKSLTHQSHHCVEINEAANQCAEQLKFDFDEAEKRILMLNKISANIKDISKQQHENFEKEKSNIAKISADMIRTIVANEETLTKQLQLVFMRTMKALRPQEDRVEKQLEDLKQQKASVKQTLQCGQPWEIFRCTAALHDRTAELLKLDMVDAEEILSSKLSDVQIREHLLAKKPVPVVQENMSQHPPLPQIPRQMTPSTATTTGNTSKRPPPPPITAAGQRTSDEDYVNALQAEKLTSSEQTMPIPRKGAVGTSLSAAAGQRTSDKKDYVNDLQAAKLTSSEQTMPIPKKGAVGTSLSVTLRDFDDDGDGYVNEPQQLLAIYAEQTIPMEKAAVGASLSAPVPCFDGVGYAKNSRQIQQKTRLEQTSPNKEAVGNSLRGTLKRETASQWSNTSTVGKITGTDKAIIGVTILKQKVYIIHDNSPQIQVYDSNTLHWLSDFKLKDLNEPKQLTSCGLNNCLYLTGMKEQTVYKAESTGGKVLLQWKMEEDSYSLSTTKDGTVILAGTIKQKLKEYTAYGTLLKTIILKPDAGISINPSHALKLESGNYLISHGQSRTSKHRVCMISPDGDVLQSFGDEKGSDMNGLFGPYQLAIDEKGNVLVADCNNHRIVVLSPILQFVAEIKTDLRYPTKLCIDSATGSLYVADNELRTGSKRTDGQIIVLQPKH